MARGKGAERLVAIEAERRAIEAERAEVRLAALDAEAARIREAEAAAVEAERVTRHAAAAMRLSAAEVAIADEVTRVLVPLMAELGAAEADVLASCAPGKWGGSQSARVPAFLREAVRKSTGWWRNWWPEAIGEQPRHESVVEPLAAARERVKYCEAMLREAGDGSGVQSWQVALTHARRRLAELSGEPYREPVREHPMRGWFGGSRA